MLLPREKRMKTAYMDSRFQSRFKTKKSLREAVAAGVKVYVHDEAIFGDGSIPDGKHALVGPAPYDRRWYATIQVKDLIITSVK
jgi:hypothetical protein